MRILVGISHLIKKIKKYLQTRLALNKSTRSDLGILEILSYNLNFLKGALVLKNQ